MWWYEKRAIKFFLSIVILFSFPNLVWFVQLFLEAEVGGKRGIETFLKLPFTHKISTTLCFDLQVQIFEIKLDGPPLGDIVVFEKIWWLHLLLTKLNCCFVIRWPNWTVTQHQAQPCKRSASGSTWRERWWRFRRNERAPKLHWPLTSWNMARDSTPLWALIQIQVRGKIGVKLDIWILEMTSFVYLYYKWM